MDLSEILLGANREKFPQVDGKWERVKLWREGLECIIAFTGHAYLAVDRDIDDERFNDLGVDGFGGASHPKVQLEIAGDGGWIDSLDTLLTANGTGPSLENKLIERPDLHDHHRVSFAREIRSEIRVLGRPNLEDSSVVVLSKGIAGLSELSLELDERIERGRGVGTQLVKDRERKNQKRRRREKNQ
eukprot:TRINITY_DN5968_c0_g1_i2.p1 TRINITY_DN5968_c0_g1~~TRINITY_DN5968_c0_g1_i2.p1  ORF type:complete len:187 (+),score=61.73 TRINITY_DN5968_c0_g1_i2:340-900(+)